MAVTLTITEGIMKIDGVFINPVFVPASQGNFQKNQNLEYEIYDNVYGQEYKIGNAANVNGGISDAALEGLLSGFFSKPSGAPSGSFVKAKQDDSLWGGNGQLIKVVGGSSWVWYDSDVFDQDGMHDSTINESGTATGTHSATTLQDTSKSWTVNEWAGYLIKINGGTNQDDVAKIISNTADTLTVDGDWITTIDNTSQYQISLAGRLTIQRNGGYLIIPRVTYNASSGRGEGVFLYKNGVFVNSIFALGITFETAVVFPPEMFDCVAGDYFEIKAYNGGAGTIALLSFGNRNLFEIAQIN